MASELNKKAVSAMTGMGVELAGEFLFDPKSLLALRSLKTKIEEGKGLDPEFADTLITSINDKPELFAATLTKQIKDNPKLLQDADRDPSLVPALLAPALEAVNGGKSAPVVVKAEAPAVSNTVVTPQAEMPPPDAEERKKVAKDIMRLGSELLDDPKIKILLAHAEADHDIAQAFKAKLGFDVTEPPDIAALGKLSLEEMKARQAQLVDARENPQTKGQIAFMAGLPRGSLHTFAQIYNGSNSVTDQFLGIGTSMMDNLKSMQEGGNFNMAGLMKGIDLNKMLSGFMEMFNKVINGFNGSAMLAGVSNTNGGLTQLAQSILPSSPGQRTASLDVRGPDGNRPAPERQPEVVAGLAGMAPRNDRNGPKAPGESTLN